MQAINYKKLRRRLPSVQTIRIVSRSKRLKLKIDRQRNNASIVTKKSNVSSLADIFNNFIAIEDKEYQRFQYKHAPTLGSLYEALTGDIVTKMLPPNLGLSTVSGFIYDDGDYRSGEIDRMLVRGKGRRLGLTDKHEFHIKDVLVIFEVKKTLNKAAFIDAYEHLSGISLAYGNYFEQLLEEGFEPNIKYAAMSFANITGKAEPRRYSDIHRMSPEDAIVFYTLVQDTYSPIKIVHGYGGYKKEEGLRKVFLDFLESRGESGKIFGVPQMPNLISSEIYSIVKTTGMPFKSPRFDNGYWPIICSSRDNVVYLMIEMIWTKISVFCDVSMPWGEDLEANVMSILLSGKFIYEPDRKQGGWMYSATEIKEAELKETESKVPWEPVIVPKMVMEVAQIIGVYGGIQVGSESFSQYLEKWHIAEQVLVDDLIKTNLFSLDSEGYISFIGRSLHLIEINKTECAISDNANRLRLWCEMRSIKPCLTNFIKQT